MDGSAGIMTTVADASRRSLSTLSSNTFVKPKIDRPPGLGNYDNSCFQNSILQGLSSLKPFPDYLARVLEQDKLRSDGEPGSASTLRDLISKLTDPNYNGKTLWTPKKLKSLDTWQQQDAQEYYSKILDEVEKEITSATDLQHCSSGFEQINARDETEDSQHSDDSGYQSLPVLAKAGSDARALRNPLEGLIAQRVACVQCGYSDGLSMIPFNCLTLHLGLDQTEHDLYERLDSYTDLETIQGVECAKCTLLKLQGLLKIIVARGKEFGTNPTSPGGPVSRLEATELALEEDDFDEKTLQDRCQVSKKISSTKTKQLVIARPPQSLAIHMNRSVFDENTGAMFKNFADVRFPKTLDIGPWCLGSAGSLSSLNNNNNNHTAAEDEEQWITDPKSSMVSGDLKPSKISGPIYELRAVITHQGRHENGHYICYRKHPCRPSKPDDNLMEKAEAELVDNGDGGDAQDTNNTPVDVDDDDDDADDDGESESATGMKWWRLSDETVWDVSEESVLAQGGVFMLFYDLVDPNQILVSSLQHETKIKDGITASSPEHVVIEKTSTEDPQEIKFTGSILIPFLADGERVDPSIPLDRPNS